MCVGRWSVGLTSNLWQKGWIIFSDSNGNAAVDSGETVLRVQKALTDGDVITAGTQSNISFNRDGFALNLPVAGLLFTLRDPGNNKTITRCLAIAVSGMMTTQNNTTAPTTCL